MKSVNIIGSGNVATHLGRVLTGKVTIKSIYSKQLSNAEQLADQIGGEAISKIQSLKNVDLNIVAVKDDAISELVAYIDNTTPIVHTSGAIPLSVFEDFEQCGILYPLQTFSKERSLDLNAVPFLLEANSTAFYKNIEEFCRQNLSKHITQADSKTRKWIHLSAVFASNYTVQMLREAQSLLKDRSLGIDLLFPLVQETIQKAIDLGPNAALTGPAKRKDNSVLESHLDLLENQELKHLYHLISERIKSTT